MMGILKKTRFGLLVLVIVLITGVSGYLTVKRIAPTILSANIEDVLAAASGQKVTVGSSSIHLFPVTFITIRNVVVGEASKPVIKAKKVRVILSAWNALFGRIRIIRADLYDPLIYMDYDALKKLRLKQEEKTSPTVRIHNGIVRLPGKDQVIILDEINGTFDSDSAKLTALMLGGKTRLKATKNGSWNGVLTSRGMDLAGLGKNIRGTCDAEISFNDSGEKIVSSVLMEGEHIHLPWAKKDIETAKAEVTMQGDEKALAIERISVRTPHAEISGTGRINDPRKGTDAVVSLDLKSGAFDYETVLDFVPTKGFDAWLTKLLTVQIRGGKSRFPVARYQGTVDELIHFRNFLYRIHVEEDIMGQTFCYGPGPEKITGVTGQVIYGAGDIILRNLRGTVGGSTIEKVDLSFPRAVEPFWRIGVGVSLDVAAADFFTAWKAAGLPDYTVDLFSDVSRVRAGRIKGGAEFYWDEESGKGVEVRGRVDMNDCTYDWGKQPIQHQNATIVSKSFGAPVEATSALDIGGRHVRSFSLTISDPFRTQQSTFETVMDGHLTTDNFSLGKESVLSLKGTGRGLDIKTDADLTAERITLFNTTYRMKDRPVRAKGKISGKLAPDLTLALSGDIDTGSPGKLGISGNITGDRGMIRLKGVLDLGRFEVIQTERNRKLSGSIRGEVTVAWTGDASVEGSLDCRHAGLFVKDTYIVVDGPLTIAGDRISGRSTGVTKDDIRMSLIDWTLSLEGKPDFRGNVTLEGLSLPLTGKEGTGSRDLKSFNARGHIRINNIDMYGIRADTAQADASLKDGILNLSGISIEGSSVTAQGRASMDQTGIRSFDSTFFLKDVSIHKFLNNFSTEQDWIRGNMNLEGRLYGSKDSVNGVINLVAKEGKLKKYALFSRIFALLNVYKIIQTRDLEMTSKNFPYNEITAAFTLKDSKVHFDDFHLDSNSIQFSAVGDYSLKTREIDAIIGVQPFETIDKTIHAIPIIGWILTGDKGTLLIISMTAKGNIDDPSVKIAPIKTISDPVKKSLIRAMRLPSEIYKKSKELFQNNGKK